MEITSGARVRSSEERRRARSTLLRALRLPARSAALPRRFRSPFPDDRMPAPPRLLGRVYSFLARLLPRSRWSGQFDLVHRFAYPLERSRTHCENLSPRRPVAGPRRSPSDALQRLRLTRLRRPSQAHRSCRLNRLALNLPAPNLIEGLKGCPPMHYSRPCSPSRGRSL